MHDILIVGGGIFGISAAIELARRKYKVGLINPDTIPHHLAASTDISKAIRMEYGADEEYFRMAEICIDKWKAWNDLLGVDIYHNVGFLMLSKKGIENDLNSFEKNSYQQLINSGYQVDKIGKEVISRRFPAVNSDIYTEACYNPKGGYVASGLAIELMAKFARSIGVEIYEGQTCCGLIIEKGILKAVKTREGKTFKCGHALIAAGAHTPHLIPALRPYMRITGHPVYWLEPVDPEPFGSQKLPVFMADIANSGWYGFPYCQEYGIVKIAKHSSGISIDPDNDPRVVTREEIIEMRKFVKESFQSLADARLVYTRRCLYTDTLDGHFWIDQHPEIEGLSVSTGGSGHGMKMGPLLGEMAADVVEGRDHQFSKRYRWRDLKTDTMYAEEARFLKK